MTKEIIGYTTAVTALPKTDSGPDTNGYEYVDLGLPSGALWATMNVGAEKETDYGLYFQWGDTQGYTSEQIGRGEGQKLFSWDDYKWTEDGGSTMSKYNVTDGKTVLDLEDDAARVNWGGNWKIPTKEQLQELIDNTNNEQTTVNNVNGCKFTSKTDSSKYIFIPAAGSVLNGSRYGVGNSGIIWSSSLKDQNSYILNSKLVRVDYSSRCSGLTVRPVIR